MSESKNSCSASTTPSVFSETHVTLPGVRLRYLDSGGHGTPVVLLHANTGTAESWLAQMHALSQAGYRVIAFDRRGWGKSTAIPNLSAQPGSVAEDLDALASHLQLRNFHLVGIAGGGFVALDYAAWRPERLLKLIVAGSNGQFVDPEMLAYYARIAIPGLTGNPSLRPYLEVGVSYRSEDPKGFSKFIEMAHASRQADAPAQPLRTPNTFAKLAAIQASTLILMGGADLLAPPALMRTWATYLKRVKFVDIPDAGHSINWERPQQFNEIALNFLNSDD